MERLPEVLYRWSDHPARASRTQPEYSPESFLACRAHHLSRFLRGRPVIVWGAGRDGRRAARALLREQVEVAAFLDIDPRKIGRTAFGAPIRAAEEWLARSAPGEEARPLILAAVGTAGARDLIRARLVSGGFREGTDFLCIA
jgi:FlaA1/EpsC-like NDP-sugar epimerase